MKVRHFLLRKKKSAGVVSAVEELLFDIFLIIKLKFRVRTVIIVLDSIL